MGKKNTRKRGPSRLEIRMGDRQAEGWTFHKHYKRKGGVPLLIGIKAEKDPFEVTGSTLAAVLDEIDNTNFDKLLKEHGLKKIEPKQPTVQIPEGGNVYIDGQYVGKTVSNAKEEGTE